MIYTRCESHFWRFERIVCWEMYCQEKHTSLIRTVRLLVVEEKGENGKQKIY